MTLTIVPEILIPQLYLRTFFYKLEDFHLFFLKNIQLSAAFLGVES
jgi:hypothetical protein